MAYKVVPFNAQIQAGHGADQAASQLESLVNHYQSHGWSFQGLETIDTVVVSPAVPGTNGCLGFGAVPGIPEGRTSASVYVAVFRQQ